MNAIPRLWTFSTSPFAGKARIAFLEKGVEVELVEIHPAKRPARLRELNVLNRVPVLELGDLPIRESSAICEWLEDTHPEPALWPADPDVRAWARGWAKFVDDTLMTNYFLGMRKMAFGKADDDPEDIVVQLHARLGRNWGKLEEALAMFDGPWLAGEQFTIADITGMPLAVRLPQWTPHLVPDPDAYPLITAWMQALRDRPSATGVDQAGAEQLTA